MSSSACVQPRKWLAGCQYGWQQVWGRAHLRQRKGVMKSLCYTYHNTNVYMPWRHRNGATVAIVHLCVYNLLTSLICTHRISTPSLDFRHATGQATGKRKGGLERRRGGGAERECISQHINLRPDWRIASCLKPLFEPNVCSDIQHRFGNPIFHFGNPTST